MRRVILIATGLVAILVYSGCVQPGLGTEGWAFEGRTRLNNLVVELLRAEGLAAEHKSYAFENPREGWVFFRTTAKVRAGGSVAVSVAGELPEGMPAQVTRHAAGGAATQEAMRYLPKGEYTLKVQTPGGGRLTSFTVRAIPEIIYAAYPGTSPIKGYGPFDWDFLKRCGMLSSCNVMIAGGSKVVPAEWIERDGKRIIHHAGVPGLGGKKVTADEVTDYWGKRAYTVPESSGITMDEFYPCKGFDVNHKAWAEGVARAAKAHPDREFRPYIAHDPMELRPFVEPLIGSPVRFAYERYPCEVRGLRGGRESAQKWMVEDMRAFQSYAPGFQKRCIYVMGFLCGPNETCNTEPSVNFKTFMDMQFNAMATDPALVDLYGVQMYLSSYCDEEYLRWCAKLFRHYCIEGNTRPLSTDPYELKHVTNPDFEDGLKGWRASAAGPGRIAPGHMKGYGWLQSRGWVYGTFPPTDVGDTFLRMKRSADAPNTVSQRIRRLEPGRAYSLKMVVSDVQAMTSSAPHAFSIRIEGADIVSEHTVREVFANCYAHTVKKYGNRKTYFTWVRMVFRPRGRSARLVISDWESEKKPGGPPGQELIFNFVEVEPFLSPEK